MRGALVLFPRLRVSKVKITPLFLREAGGVPGLLGCIFSLYTVPPDLTSIDVVIFRRRGFGFVFDGWVDFPLFGLAPSCFWRSCYGGSLTRL